MKPWKIHARGARYERQGLSAFSTETLNHPLCATMTYGDGVTTGDPKHVTCKRCLARMARLDWTCTEKLPHAWIGGWCRFCGADERSWLISRKHSGQRLTKAETKRLNRLTELLRIRVPRVTEADFEHLRQLEARIKGTRGRA